MRDLRTQKAWAEIHQPYELNWWRENLANGHSQDDVTFIRRQDEIDQFIQPHGQILDIGCGPRPLFRPCTIIDPLANEYRILDSVKLQWWYDVDVYTLPAEKLIEKFVERFDTVIAWNMLDHAHGWRDILTNMWIYSKPNATIAIATDFWPEPFDGHPGYPREEFMAEIDKHFNIIETREPFGHHLALRMTAKAEGTC